jgi:hypothetical protein
MKEEMIERLLKLAKKAKLKYDSETALSPQEQEFAELIIRDCANMICVDAHITLPTKTGGSYSPVTEHGVQLSKNLLNNFGIKF